MQKKTTITTVLSTLSLLSLTGCGTTQSSESASIDTMTAHVGRYSMPPAGATRARVGVPTFTSGNLKNDGVTRIQYSSKTQNQGRDVDTLAADQLSTLAFKSGRFDVIERSQLTKLLKEQELEGVVKADELAETGKVRGVDYLFLGKVTSLRVEQEKSSTGYGLGNVGGVGKHFIKELGGLRGDTFNVKKDKTVVKVECGVDIRLVDPESGSTIAADFGEYNRTDTIQAMGMKILGSGSKANADLEISESDKGRILRLALDDALRKMLPTVDSALGSRAPAAPAVEQPAGITTPPAIPTKAGASFCSNCGSKLGVDAKFCGKCGTKKE